MVWLAAASSSVAPSGALFATERADGCRRAGAVLDDHGAADLAPNSV